MDKQRDEITRREVECEEPGVTRYRGAQGVHTSSMESSREMQEIRRDIAHTRAEMAETMYVIRHRLSPEHLKQQAKDATVGRAKEAVDDARHQAKGFRESAMETIRQNPVPAAMVALGLGWLIVEGRGPRVGHAPPGYSPVGSRVDQFTDRVQDRTEEFADDAESAMLKAKLAAEEKVSQVGDMAEQAQDQVTHLSDEAKAKAEELRHEAKGKAEELRVEVQQQAEYAKTRVGEFVHRNPLAAGAIALAIGAALGSVIPETPQEDALMGEQHDRLMSEAEQRAQDTLQRAKSVAKEAAQSAKETAEEEAQRQDLIPEGQEKQHSE